MNRGKKVIVLAHCILNQNSVVYPYGRNMEEFKKFIMEALDKNIGIVQLPCPELKAYGLKRWGHVKDQFEYREMEDIIKKLLKPYVDEIINYKNNGYEIEGIYGIKGSPSCGISLTCRGNWSGEASSYESIEDIKSRVKMVEEKGIFMEIFEKLLFENNIEIKFLDVEDWKSFD